MSYFGARDAEGERKKDPKMLVLETFIKKYYYLKKDNIDPPALFNTRKAKRISRFKKGFVITFLGRVLHEAKAYQATQLEKGVGSANYRRDINVRQFGADGDGWIAL